MRVLGLDVGEKRIGVARGDSDTRIAVPVGFIVRDGSEWEKIRQISRIYSTAFFIVGLPRSNEGSETKQSLYVREFAKELAREAPEAKIRFQDESLTSVVAEERLKARKKSYEKGDIDAEAATVILQDFLDSMNNESLKNPKAAIKDRLEGVLESEKMAESGNNTEKSKNGKKKSKKFLRIFSIVMVLVILGLLATGILLWIKEKRAEERQAEYRRQEAEMVAETFNFTILPGETVFDVKKRLIEAGYSTEEVEEAMRPSNYSYGFLSGLDSLEGYLFGETHNFYETASAKDIIGQFLEKMKEIIEENNLEARYAARGLSLKDGIILASVVQKEASPADQATVAQVFLSRLSYGIPLGSDVTVTYALDVVDPERTVYTDNQSALKVNSCYNTRVNAGLPCGAISSPSLSALLAVAEPTDTAYLYFLTGDDGLMYYSYTEAEHIQNIYSHCQVLCNVSL